MKLSAADLQRLMMGGAATYRTAEGQPTPVEYWVQAYLGATTLLQQPFQKRLENSVDLNSRKPAPPILIRAFKQMDTQESSFDPHELFLLTRAHQLQLPPEFIRDMLTHPRKLQEASDAFFQSAAPALHIIGQQLEKWRYFNPSISAEAWSELPLSLQKLSHRFHLLNQNDHDISSVISTLPALNQRELLQESAYLLWKQRWSTLETLTHSRSQKVQAWIRVCSLRSEREVSPAIQADIEAWKTFASAGFAPTSKEKNMPLLPQPPLITQPLTPKQRWLAWAPPLPTVLDNQDNRLSILISIHAAYYHRDAKYLKELWQHRFPPDLPDNIGLFRAAAGLLPPDFFLGEFEKRWAKEEFRPDRVDLLWQWLFLPNIFIPAEQSQKVWPFIQDLCTWSEAQDEKKLLHAMLQHFSQRLHPTLHSEVEEDPLDFFDNALETDIQQQLEQRFQLYQTLA
jgi:hypothetical protein